MDLHVIEKVWRGESLSDVEQNALLGWLLSKSGRRQFEMLVSVQWEEFHRGQHAETECVVYDYENTLDRIHLQQETLRVSKRMQQMRRRRWMAIAAVVALIVGSAVITYRTNSNSAGIATGVQDGAATLTLADGSVMVIDDTEPLVEQQGSVIRVGSNDIEYALADGTDGDGTATGGHHEISIPTGRDYRLRLNDGSVVWLNSQTRLRYPVNMSSDERRLELIDGEAYFEVSADSERPFVVETSAGSITALGTQFNVSAYASDDKVSATLTEGVVSVTTGNHSCLLETGQQAVIKRGSGQIAVERVNADDIGAWRNGYIVVEDLTLDEVMQKLERWYGIEYSIAPDVGRQTLFRGVIPRHSLTETLETIEMISDLDMHVDGDRVEVTR
jgi:ferric-dicitrate binding protein FerR (iron transport regulator)